MTSSRIVRWLWLAAAWVALGLGAIGVLVPGLPTVPFILLASFCAARGSKRLHAWLLAHRTFGPMIRDWEAHGAVSRRAKRLALGMMALCSLLMWLSPARLWMWATGTGIMAVVGVWLWRRPEPSSCASGSVAEAGPTLAAGQRSTRRANR
ncbi:YbaN family protein [Rehaibacterium terrae]|jgi:uncharacterized membrane protein YbaN (DUF454 family)|uniref:Inner membrane protein n=1 Tax=Rehaibacterium terrae TaxID=1341696 RepID=A0A7W7XZG2_9GAMM|nr:YbaN family protein [Rehaibacterium terrae]MBB5015309.1 hypothetical protein [Rehaibacterium terrae]